MAMNQLKAGAFLSYVSICLNMMVGLLYTPYMLRMLGRSEYGLYSLAASVIAYLTVLDLGFGNAIVRYTAKFRAEGKEREQREMFGMFFSLYVAIGLVAVVAGASLALNADRIFSVSMTALEVHRTRLMLWLMTFNLAFTFPMSIWGSIMTAYERFVFQRLVSIVRGVLNPVVMVLLLVVGYKAVAMVVVTTLFNVVTLLVNSYYCRRKLGIKIRFGHFDPVFLKEVSAYSFWIFLNAIMDRIYWSTGQFVLGMYKGTAAVAVYSLAVQLTQMFMLFSTAISGVFLPKVTAMVTRGGSDREISELFIRTGRIQYIVMSFILSSFVLFGRPFIRLWAGDGYERTYYISLLFFFSLLIPLIQNLGITILQARNQMRFRSVCYVIIALCSLSFSAYGARRWGEMGCAYATAGALLLGQGLVMNLYYRSRQGLDIFRFWREIGRMSAMPVLLVALGLWGMDHWGIDLSAPAVFVRSAFVFTALYALSFWFVSMNAYERDLFVSPFKKIKKRKT
ncbi:oligosaccharide flippase family protein [uncultured Parabacteroides sp.]|uniref:oligosaccharide flippase family protein n=1 Tax=uncultured Parabacteroides sp. TaxID=512312 RepID=UPI002604BCE1|nr:oligosaccharide flippase family protein [uncultured Parabacteroides sp.]